MSTANIEATNSIMVLGTGELGMEVLRHLADQTKGRPGFRLSAMVRTPPANTISQTKQHELDTLASWGVDLVEGDIVAVSQQELSDLVSPYDTVISCIGFSAGSGTQVKITRAVLDAGVSRYIPWQFGVDYDAIGRGSAQDVFDEQLDVRDLLRGQNNTEWLIIATGMFTSFLFDPSFGIVDLDNNVVHALGSWENQVTVTTPEDIGRLTAEILLFEPRLTNQVVFVAGDTLSYGELADKVDQVLHRLVRREVWSIPYLESALAASQNDNLLKYRAVFAAGVGVAWPMEDTFNARQGIETTDVSKWIQQHLML
ncbi:aromatic alcohol reductase [Halomonas cupida]|uniref:aromatic alcohol reductase n=1 Tax=Halomonas cupida TaxID=44933 RepID=UPI003A925C54